MDRHETVELFRERLRDVIRESGLSQTAFAEKVGVDRSTLSQILSSTSQRLPRVETLTQIAQSEHISIDWLVGLTQQGSRGPGILPEQIEIQPRTLSPSDERLAQWHREAEGYKIRYVPTTIPDLLKTPEVTEFEFRDFDSATPAQQREYSKTRLAYSRRPETDMEVCSSVQSLRGFARGEMMWQGLDRKSRVKQLELAQSLIEELYPRFRWFLFDERRHYSVPVTIFGPLRAAVYLGQMYLVVNSKNHIRILADHFDSLIRAASVQPTQVSDLIGRLLREL